VGAGSASSRKDTLFRRADPGKPALETDEVDAESIRCADLGRPALETDEVDAESCTNSGSAVTGDGAVSWPEQLAEVAYMGPSFKVAQADTRSVCI
jgi:hypothetical protein